MKEEKLCQSCGMPMHQQKDYGTNNDGSISDEYCTYCFQKGKFTEECTMEEMVEHNLQFLEEFNKDANTKFSREEARCEMLKFFPSLKRWN